MPYEEIGTSGGIGGARDVLELRDGERPGTCNLDQIACAGGTPYEEIGTSACAQHEQFAPRAVEIPVQHDDVVVNAASVPHSSETCTGLTTPTLAACCPTTDLLPTSAPRCRSLEGVVKEKCEINNEQREPRSVISNSSITRPADTAKTRKEHGSTQPTAKEAKLLRNATRTAARLRQQVMVTRYELELLTNDCSLSQKEDVALKIRALEEDGDLGGLRAAGSSTLSRPCAPEGRYVQTRPSETQPWGERLSRLEASVQSLTSLSARSDMRLWELYARARKEQLDDNDVISRCAPQEAPVTNPMCNGKSLSPLQTMLPVDTIANRGMLYISTNTAVLEQLATAHAADTATGGTNPEVTSERLIATANNSSQTRYHSLGATLRLGHERAPDHLVKMVVDSGAAESGADLCEFERRYPTLIDEIEPVTDRRFVDAQDREIPLVGRILMKVCLPLKKALF